MTDDDALFGDEGLRTSPSPDDAEITAGERMRRRQAARIARGYHPLPFGHLRLHPDAPRVLSKEAAAEAGDYPSCGTCRFREVTGGHARDFPKCLFGREERPVTDEERARYPYLLGDAKVRITTPRMSHSEATDVRAWWPACIDWQPKEDA